jgi:hypothetical protein
MSVCSIDAEYRAEERYSKLSLAYANEEEYEKINKVVAEMSSLTSLVPSMYTSNISNGRKVLVIEFHDDYDREAGNVFNKIMKKLNITACN